MATNGALGRLNVALGLDVAEFTRGLTKAERDAKGSLDRIARQAKVAATALSGIGVAVGALAAREILKASEAMDAMGKRAQGLGVAVAPLTEISYQAEKAGLDLNELDVGLRRVSRTAYDAARGNDAAVDVFKTMGIAVTDTAGNLRSTESLWRDVADWFAKTEDSSYKAGVGYRLFGTQVTALTPILNEGSAGLDAAAAKARELGIVFDGEAASAAARLNDSLFDLKKRVDGFWMAVSVQAIPILSDFTEALFESDSSVTTLAGSVQSFARDQALLDWIDVVGAGLAHLTDVLVGLAKLVQAVSGSFQVVFADVKKFSAIGGMATIGIDEMFDPGKAAEKKAEYERIIKERDQILADANAKWSDVWNFDGSKFADAWTQAMQAARDRLNAIRVTTPPVKLVDLTAPKPPTSISGTKKTGAKDDDPLGLFITDQNIQYGLDQYQKYLDFIGEATGRTQKAQLDQQKSWLEQAVRNGDITYDEFAKAMDKIAAKSDDTFDLMGQFSIQAARNIQDAIGDGLYDLLSGNFDNIAASWGDMITRMVAQAAAAQLGNALFGNFDKSGKIGGLIGQIGAAIWPSSSLPATASWALPVMSAKGNVFPGGSDLDYYRNTIVSSPTLFRFAKGGAFGMMGEAGSEAVMPLARGADGRLGVQAHGAAPRVAINLINQGDPVQATQRGEPRFDGEQWVIDVMLDRMNRSSAVRSQMRMALSGG